MKYVGTAADIGQARGKREDGWWRVNQWEKKINGERIHVLIKGIRDSTPNIVSTCTNTSQITSSSIILA